MRTPLNKSHNLTASAKSHKIYKDSEQPRPKTFSQALQRKRKTRDRRTQGEYKWIDPKGRAKKTKATHNAESAVASSPN